MPHTPGRLVHTRIVALALLGTALAAGCRRTAPRAAPHPAASLPLTLTPTALVSPREFGATVAISPIGELVAYLGVSGYLRRQVYVRPLGQNDARALPGTDGAAQLFFSPDGQWLGFVAEGRLRKVPLDGSAPISLTDVGFTYGASWAPNDRIVVSTEHRLEVVPASGGAPRALTRLDSAAGELDQRWPLVLADGKTVLYTSWGPGGRAGAKIGAASLETGKTRILDLPGAAALGVIDGQLVYVNATGTLMAVPFDAAQLRVTGRPGAVLDKVVVGEAKATISRSGLLLYQPPTIPYQLVLADLRGGMHTVIEGPQAYWTPRFSPDGKHIALQLTTPADSADVWIYDIDSDALTRLTTQGSRNVRPEWTPDGKRVLFQSNRNGAIWLWWQPVDGSGPAEPLLKAAVAAEGVFTPDGHTLIYRLNATNTGEIWYRRLEGDTTPKPIATSTLGELAPRLSPDGRWVAYTSDESSTRQVYVQPFPGPGARYQVSLDGGFTPVWSRDGRTLFYLMHDQILAATLTTTPAFAVTARATLVSGRFTYNQNHANFDVSLDGTQFLLARENDAIVPSTIVVRDLREELRAHGTRSKP